MGSNAIPLSNEDLCCPVCKCPLSSPAGSLPKHRVKRPSLSGRARSRAPHNRNHALDSRHTRVSVGKCNKDADGIVLARCGHIYHTFCLRNFCYTYKDTRLRPTTRAACPTCHKHISMTHGLFIDYAAHQGKVTDLDKDFKHAEIMNAELSEQKESVKKKLKKLKEAMDDAYHHLQIYRTHRKKLKLDMKESKSMKCDIDELYNEIEQADKMLSYMQTHHLKIVRKFIAKAKQKEPKDFVHLPRRLAPYLHIIEEDDRLVRNLGEIIVPIQVNHLKSDRRSLLNDIITVVNERLALDMKNTGGGNTVTTKPESPIVSKHPSARNVPAQSSPIPPVVVKVHKSSVAILGSEVLTKESIKKILASVENPIKVMKEAYQASKLKEKVSNNVVDNVSASDIKIIYMPKRKMLHQLSEPCRLVDDTESFYFDVPVRKCKSTDAVLVKSKKKRRKLSVRQVSKCKLKLANRRSQSITAISLSKGFPARKKKVPTVPSTTATTRDTAYQSAASNKTGNVLNRWNLDENNNPISIISSRESLEDERAPNWSNPAQATSVLQMIYENLEKERKSSHQLVQASRKAKIIVEENHNSFSLNNHTDLTALRNQIADATDCVGSQCQRPQFYRVDGKGIVRPESPNLTCYSQPTFLSVSTDRCPQVGLLMAHPDEENQLDALTQEERLLILAEYEAIQARNKSFQGGRRPMFHGIPACLGMPNSHLAEMPPDPSQLPFYLKKWQQQLPSHKVLQTTTPRRVTNILLKSPRLSQSHSLKRGMQAYEYISVATVSTSPKYSQGCQLPPLSMFPVKRPSTAQCNRPNEQHPEGPEALSRLYYKDLATNWLKK